MAKIFLVDGQLKIVQKVNGVNVVRNYKESGSLIALLSNPKTSALAKNMIKLAGLLDQDTGVTDTNYSEQVIGG